MDQLLIQLCELQVTAGILGDKIKSLERKLFMQSKVKHLCYNGHTRDKLHNVAKITKDLLEAYAELNAVNATIARFMEIIYN